MFSSTAGTAAVAKSNECHEMRTDLIEEISGGLAAGVRTCIIAKHRQVALQLPGTLIGKASHFYLIRTSGTLHLTRP